MTAKNRPPYKEYLRFGMTGVLNTGTDFLVLNSLLFFLGPNVANGTYAVAKVISFSAAVVQSYLLNKFWVFSSPERERGTTEIGEGGRFLLVSMLGLVLNLISSSFVFALLSKTDMIGHRLAGNIGAMVGTMFVFLWNYIGYKKFVFRTS